ncbi:hypothetical protein FKM82_008399 [Ascaphus truei]
MATYTEVKVQGYEEYCKEVEKHKAEPIVRGELESLPEGSVFIYCQVGERAYWKDPSNEFKSILKLTYVPTTSKVWNAPEAGGRGML